MKAIIAAAAIAGVNVWLGNPFPMWLALIPIAFMLIKPLFIIAGSAILLVLLLLFSAVYGGDEFKSTISAMKDGVKEELKTLRK